MKFIASILLTLVLSGVWAAGVPTDGGLSQKLKSALKNGKANELVALFNKNVELVIDSEKVDFSKISTSQAEQILKAFFKKHPPHDFQFVYQSTGATMRYNTGTYLTGTDAYLVYILLKKAGNQYVVETLHFRKEQPPTAKR